MTEVERWIAEHGVTQCPTRWTAPTSNALPDIPDDLLPPGKHRKWHGGAHHVRSAATIVKAIAKCGGLSLTEARNLYVKAEMHRAPRA